MIIIVMMIVAMIMTIIINDYNIIIIIIVTNNNNNIGIINNIRLHYLVLELNIYGLEEYSMYIVINTCIWLKQSRTCVFYKDRYVFAPSYCNSIFEIIK